MTMEMAQASLPIVTLRTYDVTYNELHGYTTAMDVAFQQDSVTVLGENRNGTLAVTPYGREVTGVTMSVRSIDGGRLIEETQLTDLHRRDGEITVDFALKDLIEKGERYSIVFTLTLDEDEEVAYYTTALWEDDLYTAETFAFIQSFHEALFDKEAAKDLTKYLEPNAKLTDNTTLQTSNIHSSFSQITYGDLAPTEVGEAAYTLVQKNGTISSVLVDYTLSSGEGEDILTYRAREYYRVRYTADRMYLLDYERTLTQLPDVDGMYANDKILLGIVSEDVDWRESEDGNTVVFVDAGQLLGYNAVTNGLTVIFSFYDEENQDARTTYDSHNIKILDVDEGGNVRFAVYGYMNRGRHEGEVGIALYSYNSSMNTIEEEVYIPYARSYAVLEAEMEQLLYLNRSQHLYLFLEDTAYEVNLEERTYTALATISQDDSMLVSENHKILVWLTDEDVYHSTQMNIRNLNDETENVITTNAGEVLMPLGFMGEDIIYGVAYESDVVTENSGQIFFPMYKICICDSTGSALMEYEQTGIYITGCTVTDNQITLTRKERTESGFIDTTDDQIMNNVEEEPGKNSIVTASIDIYERYVEIQTKATIDTRTIKVLNPKEIVFEGGRELALETETETEKYYVYGPYGVAGIYHSPGKAVAQAYASSGTVCDDSGVTVWTKTIRATRNQIMAIKEPEQTSAEESLAVCLDTMLSHVGIIRNSAYLLSQGQTATQILSDSLPDARVLDLGGCELDAVLYYVNQDIPVLAILNDGEAVLITGFNDYNVVIYEPSTGTLYKKGINDSAEWFAENGNHFLTYMWVS